MKKLISLFLAFCLCFLLCGCNFVTDVIDMTNPIEETKTFDFDGISIDLTTKFLRIESPEKDFDFTVGNETLTILGEKFDKTEVELPDFTLLDFATSYTALLAVSDAAPINKINDIPYTTYTSQDHTFFTAFYEGSKYFWVVSFGCLSSDYQDNYDDICNYAKSVKCE